MLAITYKDSNIDGLLTTTGFVALSDTEVISKATVEVLSSCCSSTVINTFEIDPSVIDTDNYSYRDSVATLLPAAYLQTGAIQESLYSIRIILDVTVSGTLTAEYLAYTVCWLNDSELKCKIANILLDNIYDTELVIIYNSIQTAIDCGDCCTACKLYTYLIDKLNECTNC